MLRPTSSIELERSPDCVKVQGSRVVVACYQLAAPEHRQGGLHLFDHDAKKLRPTASVMHNDWGVFDVAFHNSPSTTLIGAQSDGRLCIYDAGDLSFKGCLLERPGVFCLSVDSRSGLVASSFSNGRVVLLKDETVVFDIDAHPSSEVWTAAINPYDENMVFSGADDGYTRIWDVRMGESIGVIRNAHEGSGVCSFEFLGNASSLVSGGYDGCMRRWDVRKLNRPLRTSSRLGNGGVWRIKRKPSSERGILAAACIRGGFALFDEETLQVTSQYPPGASTWEPFAYGIDWLSCSPNVLVGCSFYDKTVQVLEVTQTS